MPSKYMLKKLKTSTKSSNAVFKRARSRKMSRMGANLDAMFDEGLQAMRESSKTIVGEAKNKKMIIINE